jgi:hypothetical protein
MSRTRDEMEDVLQKSRISRDMNQEPDYNPQRNFRPNSGEVYLSEPRLQTSSYDSSDVGGPKLKTQDTTLYQNSPTMNLPGAFPTNALDDNKRNHDSSISRREQTGDYNGITKNTGHSTDYSAGQIDNDPILRLEKDLANQTPPSSGATGDISSNLASDQKNINPALNNQTQSMSQTTDGKKSFETGISDPAMAKTFGSTDIAGDSNSAGNNAGMAKSSTAAAAVGGFGAKIGSMLGRRKSKETELQNKSNTNNLVNQKQDWNQDVGSRKSMDVQRPDVSGDSTAFGKDQSGTWNKQGQRSSLPATSSSYDKNLSGNMMNQGVGADLSGADNSLGNDQSGNLTTQGERGGHSGIKNSLATGQSGDLKSKGQLGDLSGTNNSLETDQSGNLKPQGESGDLSGMKGSLGADQYGNSTTLGQRGNLSGTNDSLGTDQYGNSKTLGQRGDLSGTNDSFGTGQSANLNNQRDTTKPYDDDGSKLDTHKNLALGVNNDATSNAATYGSIDAPYDSGNLEKETQEEKPSSHTGAKAVAAGATAGGIGAMLSSVLGRKKSSGDVNDKTVGNKGDIPSSGNMADGDMASGNLASGNMPSGSMPSGDMSSRNMPSGNMHSDSMASGNMPSGNMPSGSMPSGDMSSRNMPSGNMHSENMTSENMTNGSMPSGNAPNNRHHGPAELSTARDSNPPNITTNNISSPMDARINTNNSLDSGGINSSNKGISGATNLDMNSPSQGHPDVSTLGIPANQANPVKGNLDNSHGINTQYDGTNQSNEDDLLKPPSTQSFNNNNEPMSNGETVVDDKKNKVSGFASYIFGNELKFQGSYKVCFYTFLCYSPMLDDIQLTFPLRFLF